MEMIGKYEILGEIGAGGFGTVFKGRDPVLKRVVAIKSCSTQNEEVRARFQREAEIIASLHDPNITMIYDFGLHSGHPYLVQELLDGEDLTAVIARKDPLPLETRLRFLTESARALEHAHDSGVVHRDIKPGNIRILDDGSVKVMDFGIAKLDQAETKLTKTGTMLGTAAYLSPEQIDDSDVDHRCDIFSFGVLAYELIAYERPFQGSTVTALLYKILQHDPKPLRELVPACPPELASLIHRCLEKTLDKRPQSFHEIHEELERLRSGAITGSLLSRLPARPDIGDDATLDLDRSASSPVPLADARTRLHRGNATGAAAATVESKAFTAASPGGKVLLAAAVLTTAVVATLWFARSRDQRPVPASGLTGTSSPTAEPSAPRPAGDTGYDQTPAVEDSIGNAAEDITNGALPPASTGTQTPSVAPSPRDRSTALATQPRASEPMTAVVSVDLPPTAPLSTPERRQPELIAAAEERVRDERSDREQEPARPPPTAAVIADGATLTTVPTTEAVDIAAAARRRALESARAALGRYRAAYESRDTALLASVWPSLDSTQRNRIERSFSSFESISLTLDPCTFELDGATATARCSVHRDMKPRAGRIQSVDSDSTFRLAERDGRWIITAIE